ncbi:MAG: DMT family transporter [Acidimicrobiales bacterium]|nr:DMT family transporter [Acidimicrobiales bacterium]
MTALVALLGSMIVGSADFLFGVAARRSGPLSTPLVGQLCGLSILSLSLVAFDAPEVRFADLAWGGISGIAAAVAYILFLSSMSKGKMSVVAPIAAATGAAVAALYGSVFEEGLGLVAVVGIVAAIVSIVLVCSEGPIEGNTPSKAIWLAVLSGGFFGILFVSLAFTSTNAGMWPLVASRATSVPLLVVVNLVVNRSIRFNREDLAGTVLAGIMEMLASILLLWALRRGPVAIAGVFGSLYPTSTVLLAWILLGERLRSIQKLGVCLALAAAVLAAV